MNLRDPHQALQVVLQHLFATIFIPVWSRMFAREAAGSLNLRVLLVGYSTPACVLQHSMLAQHLRLSGATTKVAKTPDILGPDPKSWTNDDGTEGKTFGSFNELVRFILSETSTDYHFQRGTLDEYLRQAPLEWLTRDFYVPNSFIEIAHKIRGEAQLLLETYSALVLAESAYLKKRALLSVARERDIPVWILSPKGEWLRIDDSKDEDSGDEGYAAVRASTLEDLNLVNRARSYVEQRFQGETAGDIDAPLVYGSQVRSLRTLEPRKVLFLHSIRDANQLSLRTKENASFFPTYLEWTEAAFAEISKNPDDWWIKPHPTRISSPDEYRIIEVLLARYKLPPEIVRSDLDTKEILQNRFPVYTHSGTIALETAVHGYKAHVCSSTIPHEISIVSLDRASFRNRYSLSLQSARTPIHDEESRDTASVLLYRKFLRPARAMSPQIPFPDKSSKESYRKSLSSQTFQFLGVSLRPSAHRKASKLASEIMASAQ